MIRSFSECGPPIEDDDVRAIEQTIGFVLPGGYREFLLAQNGGRPEPEGFPIEDLANNPYGMIQVFYRIDGEIESSNIDWNYHLTRGRLPDNLLPIASDGGGDHICLSLYGDDAGSVVFWDCHQETQEPSYDNVYFIAKSFEEFLEGIQDLPG
jgi:hypothetical protein